MKVSVLPLIGIIIGGIVVAGIILFFNDNILVTENNVHVLDLDDYTLNLVNEDRHNRNFSELSLGDNQSAQSRADDLLKNRYFSHWNSYGVKPYVEYTKYGGNGVVLENISRTKWQCTGFCNPSQSDILKEINLHEKDMMYDDAHVDWGHRDTILDPYVTHVNFGIAHNDEYLYVVQHFERNIIEWDDILLKPDGDLSLSGFISPTFTAAEILIYRDPKPIRLSSEELNTKIPYINQTYDKGSLVGIIAPTIQNYEYVECSDGKIAVNNFGFEEKICISYEKYTNKFSKENKIDISTNVSKWFNQDDDDSIHTIYLRLNDTKNNQMVDATSLTLEYLK